MYEISSVPSHDLWDYSLNWRTTLFPNSFLKCSPRCAICICKLPAIFPPIDPNLGTRYSPPPKSFRRLLTAIRHFGFLVPYWLDIPYTFCTHSLIRLYLLQWLVYERQNLWHKQSEINVTEGFAALISPPPIGYSQVSQFINYSCDQRGGGSGGCH